MSRHPVYCIDTNALILGAKDRYPHDAFPTFWEKLEALVRDERLVAPESVLRELKVHNDLVYRWAAAQKRMFIPLDAYQGHSLMQMAAAFPPLVSRIKTRGAASETDQQVVALARARKCLVVSEEAKGSISKPKIPELCSRFGIEQIKLLEIILREKWVFR